MIRSTRFRWLVVLATLLVVVASCSPGDDATTTTAASSGDEATTTTAAAEETTTTASPALPTLDPASVPVPNSGVATVWATAIVAGDFSLEFPADAEVASCTLSVSMGASGDGPAPTEGAITAEFRFEEDRTSVPRMSFADNGHGTVIGGVAVDGDEWGWGQSGSALVAAGERQEGGFVRLERDGTGWRLVDAEESDADGRVTDLRVLWSGEATGNLGLEKRDALVLILCRQMPASIVNALGGIEATREALADLFGPSPVRSNEPPVPAGSNEIKVMPLDDAWSSEYEAPAFEDLDDLIDFYTEYYGGPGHAHEGGASWQGRGSFTSIRGAPCPCEITHVWFP